MLSNSVFCNTLTETHSVAVLLVVIMESRVARIFFLVLCHGCGDWVCKSRFSTTQLPMKIRLTDYPPVETLTLFENKERYKQLQRSQQLPWEHMWYWVTIRLTLEPFLLEIRAQTFN